MLLVIASVYPTGVCANMTLLIRGRRGLARAQSISQQQVGFVAGYAIVVAVCAVLRPHLTLVFHLPSFLPWLILAPLVGLLCIAGEYAVGVGILYLRTGRLITRATVHSSYSEPPKVRALDVASILALVVGEELILRQLLYRLLTTELAVAAWVAILLCAAAYAVNHLSFGTATAVAKIWSGVLYVGLYDVSGLAIIVVIIAHATQNLALVARSRASS